jgi:hypothetical protein
MRTLGRLGLWVGSCVLAAAASPVAMTQMGQMPGSDPMGLPGGTPTGGRSGRTQPTQPQPQQPGPISPELGSNDGKLEHDQAKLRNMDRQKQIVADTQKLVTLANELQADVQKSNKDMLSLDVIRKADEIEKLAKSVRDRMKGS